ncbi:MAG: hypothetical protein ACLP59_20535 [Bryobacteraceae bacterium]
MQVRFNLGFLLFPICALLISAGGAWAEPPLPKPDNRACIAGAESFLDKRLAVWQQRMNLTDWKISIVMSHPAELKPKTLGNVHWDSIKKTAVIRVLDASDYRLACRDMLADMEMTVVHELVHLELSSLPRPPSSRHEEELAVNRIADALLKLDRQNAPADVAESKADTASVREAPAAAAQ